MIGQGNFIEPFSIFSHGLDSVSDYLSIYWGKINTQASFIEIGIVIFIGFLTFTLQKIIHKRYIFPTEQKKYNWFHWFYTLVFAFLRPLLFFIFLSFAMSISSIITSNLEVYQFAIQFVLIWFIYVLVTTTIPDIFVRWVISCTLIPLLIFNALEISESVLNYLDSLGFTFAGIHFSIFLILKTLLIGTCLFWVARFICQIVFSFIESQKKIDPEIRDLTENLFQIILYTTLVLITLDLVGIDLKSLAIIGGAIGIGIGLGLQKIAANFISGIIILFEQNVKVGHLVEIPGGAPGWIRHLGARAAVIDTGDGRELLVPNEELLTKTVIDWTSKDRKTRTDLRIKVNFKSDLEKARHIILEAAATHPICSKISPPSCYLEKFADNGAQFLLHFWVDDLSLGPLEMQNDVLLKIWKQFAQENIEHAPLLIA